MRGDDPNQWWTGDALNHMKYTEILKLNRELEQGISGEEYKIAILSNITINQIKDVLELSLRKQGINAALTIGGYDTIIQDSKLYEEFSAVIIFWEVCNLIEGFHCQVNEWAPEVVEAFVEKIGGEIELVLSNLKNTSLVAINSFSSLLFESNPLKVGQLERICCRLNAVLETHVTGNQVIVNTNSVISSVGIGRTTDWRQYFASKALYSLEYYKAYVSAVLPMFTSATGRAKKVLVLDCDNTLWGGILGEDGPNGIQLGGDSVKGKIFREVQEIIRGMQKTGVLLALCSKNNISDVEEILEKHPSMVLKNIDFVAKKVNWSDKAGNLAEIAKNLNLGLESFVFVDDSLFELGMVEKLLPAVKCLHVPDQLSEYPTLMRRLWREFGTGQKTSEDIRKTQMYTDEAKRTVGKAQFGSTEEYLAFLQLKLIIHWNSGIPIVRFAQLSQKTNQFNLTTKRYTESDIGRMLTDPLYTLVAFSVCDSYGDYGVTGMAIVRHDAVHIDEAEIDSLLMSCRVIGRNIEKAFFDQIVLKLRAEGVVKLRASYMPTLKNAQVEMLYDTLGFNTTCISEALKQYEINLINYKPSNINYIGIFDCEAMNE